MNAPIKSLSDCQMDAVVMAGLLKAIDNFDMEETCKGVRGSLSTIAVERINLLVRDLDIWEQEKPI